MNYKNKHFKILEEENESECQNYREKDVKERGSYINEKLSQLPIRQILKQIKLDEILWDFDAVSLYPSAMLDEKSVYPRNETGNASTKEMNKELVKKSILKLLIKEVLL